MNKREEHLKMRLKGDAICTWIIAGFIGVLGLSKIFTAIGGFGNGGVMKGVLEGSPAFVMADGVREMLMAAAIVILALVLSSIRNTGRPFTKENVMKFRVMAILLIVCSVSRILVASIAGFFDPQATFQLTFELSDFVYGVAGVIVGIISEIFYYGHELQEELDSIA
ncbi:MAG: DUF2975 domain-containing protein [Lachnospiraceae bacterium]|nr:DUF2975 domain-containing protein [Lachnospiraceae bacterium]